MDSKDQSMEPMEEKLANISLRDAFSAGKLSDTSPKIENDKSEVSGSADRDKFMALVRKAREHAEAGNIIQALKLNRRALTIHHSEKLEKRIKKMEAFLDEEDDASDDDRKNMDTLGQGFLIHKTMSRKLYAHQKDGVLWMWSLYLQGKGGILADDMGLGKTIQVIAFLSGMFDMGKVKCVLIVLPLSLIPVWVNEFTKWTPGIDVMQFHGGSRKEMERALTRVRAKGGVLLTTYGLIVTQQERLSVRHGRDFVWDYVILDEGHKIKNPTKTSKSIHGISAKMRMILTGTPVQNNLKELWALFDYVHQGALLGTLRTFKMEFETPITRARERDTSIMQKRLGEEIAETLRGIIQPYFLRRTKADVKTEEGQEVSEDTVQMPSMTRKNDLVIWLFLSDVQKKIYEDFISLDDVKTLLMTKKSPLVALTVLKKICDHPRLLPTRACLKLGLDGEHFDEEELEKESSYESASNQIHKVADDVLIEESGKMKILMDLLNTFRDEGHKTLVFSQSRKLLDIIEKVLTNRGHKVARLDGKVTHTSEREAIVKKFQKDKTCCVFLLTIQVGGVGLTITSADRVVIYDPSWNPAVDAQAVDRAYRIGQDKNVVVYRLITCGTVEEKIYRRQVFKDSITQQTTGSSKNPYRYFTKMELRELFALDDPHFSKTQRQLQDMHADQRITDPDLDSHLAFLHSLDIFGISDHDLMFKSTEIRDDETDDCYEFAGVNEKHKDVNFIQYRIQQAQNLIAQESSHNFTYEQRNKGTRTFQPASSDQRLPERYDVPPIPDSDEASSGPVVTDLTSDEEEPPFNIEIVEDDDEDDDVVIMESPTQQMQSSEKQRRVLQPLSPEEVKHRSPQVVSVKAGGPVIPEHLIISPDGRKPVLGLVQEHSFISGREAIRSPGNHTDSPVKTLSMKLFSSPSNSPVKESTSKGKSFTPTKLLEKGKKHVGGGLSVLDGSSPQSGSRTPADQSVLVTDSPDSSCSQQSNVSPSSACRKLSFLVPNSEENSFNNSSILSASTERPNRPSCIDMASVRDALSPRLNASLHKPERGESPLKNSPRKDSGRSRRQSVCLQKTVPASDEEDNLETSIYSGDENGSGTEKRENEFPVKGGGNPLDDSDEDLNDAPLSGEEEDKENEPSSVRRLGGRNRLVSDSDTNSDSGSCFEVEESEEDDVVESVEENASPVVDDTNYEEDQATAANVGDEENSDNEREEQLFQDLVSEARILYKSKDYEESLQCVEKALTIYQEPGLQEMADKIKTRIASLR